MKKITLKRLNEIEDGIELFLKGLNDKEKRECGVNLCLFIASISTAEAKSEAEYDMLEPANILSEARDEIIQIIDREFLDILGEECVKLAKEENK